MSTVNVVTVILSNIASIVAIMLIVRKYIILKPFKRGANKGYLVGFEDGVNYGVEKAREIGRRKDDSRNIEALLRKPAIRKIMNGYGKIKEESIERDKFHAKSDEYMVYMYTGLSSDMEMHIEQINDMLKICDTEGKSLLVIMALTNISIKIAAIRVEQYDKMKEFFKDEDKIEFAHYIEHGSHASAEVISETEISRAASEHLDKKYIRDELFTIHDE